MHRHYEIEPALAPGASIADVLTVAGWPAAPGTTLIVGHEPTLGALVGHLLRQMQRPLDKGAIVWMSSACRSKGSLTAGGKSLTIGETIAEKAKITCKAWIRRHWVMR